MPKTRVAIAVAVLAIAGPAARAVAHEGHEHKIMGKVVAIDEKEIQVESTDGKRVSGLLTADTKYLRDQAPVARADVKVGQRVVIVVVENEEKVQKVKEVLVGATSPAEYEARYFADVAVARLTLTAL